MNANGIALQAHNAKDNLETILQACRANNIDSMYVDFYGSGDDGQIGSVEFYAPIVGDASRVILDETSSIRVSIKSIKQARDEETGEWGASVILMEKSLDDAVYDLVEALANGSGVNWYDSEGGSGVWTAHDIMSGKPVVGLTISQNEIVSNVALDVSTSLDMSNFSAPSFQLEAH